MILAVPDFLCLRPGIRLQATILILGLSVNIPAQAFPLFSPSAMTQGFQGTAYTMSIRTWNVEERNQGLLEQAISYRYVNRVVIFTTLPYRVLNPSGKANKAGFSNPGVGLKYRFYESSTPFTLSFASVLAQALVPVSDTRMGQVHWSGALGMVFSTWRHRTAMDSSILYNASGGSEDDALSYNWNIAYRLYPHRKRVNELLGQVEFNAMTREGGDFLLFVAPSFQRISAEGSLLLFIAYRFRISSHTGVDGTGPPRLWTLGFTKMIY